ncbi:NADH-quinone oxidoreductase subunit C [Bacteriovoracaceae bacterium]|nr:NADH-quinone oxidoreductase subunit C [Bacteriovoracaceae bacterium]
MLNDLVELLNKNIKDVDAEVLTPENGDHSILIKGKNSFHSAIKFIKENDSISFNALQVISGVDYLDHIEVNYMFANFDKNKPHTAIVKVRLEGRVDPSIDSIVDLYPAADFQERECYDMFGVVFNNHPDPRRILCPYDWEGFPLRKDYMSPKTYAGMDVFPDDKMNMNQREYIVHEKAEVARKKAEEKAASESKTE